MYNDKDIEVKNILRKLDKEYGKHIPCFLFYKKDYELLFATILAAQCKDDRVNEVTKVLFNKYKKLEDYKNARITEIEKIIKPCGLYKAKAKNIKETAKILLQDYKGKLPSEIKDLTGLPGVGRKTANVIRTHIFEIPSIVVDTHVLRTTKRLGLSSGKNAAIVEKELERMLPKEHWSRINPQLMTLGRTLCSARSPKCDKCYLPKECMACKKTHTY